MVLSADPKPQGTQRHKSDLMAQYIPITADLPHQYTRLLIIKLLKRFLFFSSAPRPNFAAENGEWLLKYFHVYYANIKM